MIVMGKRFFGRVDVVPGLLYIATTFVHLFWFPLIPLGTSIVAENSAHVTESGETAYLAKRTSFSFKSFIMAYVRGILIFAMVLALAIPAIIASGILAGVKIPVTDPQVWATAALVFAAALVLLTLSYRISFASRERGLALGRALGYADDTILRCMGSRR
jgi:hypothetical protein